MHLIETEGWANPGNEAWKATSRRQQESNLKVIIITWVWHRSSKFDEEMFLYDTLPIFEALQWHSSEDCPATERKCSPLRFSFTWSLSWPVQPRQHVLPQQHPAASLHDSRVPWQVWISGLFKSHRGFMRSLESYWTPKVPPQIN